MCCRLLAFLLSFDGNGGGEAVHMPWQTHNDRARQLHIKFKAIGQSNAYINVKAHLTLDVPLGEIDEQQIAELAVLRIKGHCSVLMQCVIVNVNASIVTFCLVTFSMKNI